MFDDLSSVMKRVLKFGTLLVLVIVVLGSLIGYFVAGVPGVLAALVGGLAALAFTGLTALSVLVGARLNLVGFLGAVLGGWLLKMLLFLVAFTVLNRAEWLSREARPIVFFTIVTAVIGGLILDTRIVSKARLSADVKLP
jgi:fructose-specific phosphotransferase system IIC component